MFEHSSLSDRTTLTKNIAGLNPRNDPEEFLQQLELHEELNRSYEEVVLTKNALSACLLIIQDERKKLLQWMGRKLFEREEIMSFKDVPKVPLRVNKIPGHVDGIGDKGFHASHGDCPKNNVVHIPDLVRNLPIYQHHENDVPRKSKLFSLR